MDAGGVDCVDWVPGRRVSNMEVVSLHNDYRRRLVDRRWQEMHAQCMTGKNHGVQATKLPFSCRVLWIGPIVHFIFVSYTMQSKARFPFKRTQRTQRALCAMRALRKRKTQATQALALATMIGCFDWAFLLASACVRCMKNRIGSIVEFSYAMTACVSCVTCTCVFLFFVWVSFFAFIAHFLFCLGIFYYARPCVRCVRLNGTPGLT